MTTVCTATPATYSIRSANKNDIDLILSFIRELASFEKLLHSVTATTAILLDSLFPEKNSPAAYAAFAYKKQEPVAMVLYYFNFSTFTGQRGLYLEDLFVLPKHRHQGLGTRLFAYLAKIAIDSQCSRFEWVVIDWNTHARAFYQKMGANEHAEWILNRMSGKALVDLANSEGQISLE